MANGPPEEGAYQCFFNRDDLPSPMEGGTLCDFPLAQLSGFPDHEEHFPLYTGARLEDMVESIRRHGVQSPILVWKTAEGTYIIISGHNRVNASKIAGLTTIPAVIRTDLTQETAEDLFYEMNFRQRSLADMLFSQRVLCIAAHYNMLKRQGRRTDLQTFETTSPDTQEKSHTDVKIAQEYELTRDKVSKYCRYATLYRPLLLLMNSGKRLGQLAAYEISFVEDHSLQECIYQFISEGSASISTAKGKKLRAAFEDGKLDASQIKSILSGGGLSMGALPTKRSTGLSITTVAQTRWTFLIPWPTAPPGSPSTAALHWNTGSIQEVGAFTPIVPEAATPSSGEMFPRFQRPSSQR